MREELIDDYFAVTVQMQRAWKRRYMYLLDEDIISLAQLGVLFLLHEKQPIQSKDIALDMRISRSAVTQLIDGLVDMELVSRLEDSTDRRNVFLQLSKKGRSKLKQLEKRRRKLFDELVAGLTDKQIASAININTHMLNELEK